MTRREKIAVLSQYCDRMPFGCCGTPACRVYMDDPDDPGMCRDFDDRTDEELDDSLQALGAGTEVAAEPDTMDHPGHYNREGAMECIEEMLLLFGREETMAFCKLNAWKYRYRAADKGGMEDLKKSDRYLAKYKELKGRAT